MIDTMTMNTSEKGKTMRASSTEQDELEEQRYAEDNCSCVWGFEAEHDYCIEADPECVIHGLVELSISES